jgi:hypothetical protein
MWGIFPPIITNILSKLYILGKREKMEVIPRGSALTPTIARVTHGKASMGSICLQHDGVTSPVLITPDADPKAVSVILINWFPVISFRDIFDNRDNFRKLKPQRHDHPIVVEKVMYVQHRCTGVWLRYECMLSQGGKVNSIQIILLV